MHTKSYAFETFVKFKLFFKKQSGYNLKKFWIDHGGEFTSNEFKYSTGNMGSSSNIPLPILHNTIEWLRGRIGLSLRWFEACSRR